MPGHAASADAPPVQRVSCRELRACLTHVAIIASRPDVQRVLPQELLGNQRVLLARDVREVQPHLPSNVHIIRGKSGWTNVAHIRG
jgi:hypothetical protein